MTTCSEALSKISEWLKQGRVDADNLIDFPWEVSREKDNIVKAVYPKFPADIYVSCDDKIGVVRVSTSLNVETVSLDSDVRLSIYRKLLRRNNVPLVKFSLVGEDDVLALYVDLSVKTLGKEEFNDALAMLLGGVMDVVKLLNIEDYYQQLLMMNLAELIKKHVDEGWGREKLFEYLTQNVGLPENEAREIIDSMFEKERRGPIANIYQ